MVIQVIDVCVLRMYQWFPNILNIIDFCCMILFIIGIIIDIVFKNTSKLKHYFHSDGNKLYFGMITLQLIGTCIGIVNDIYLIFLYEFFFFFFCFFYLYKWVVS